MPSTEPESEESLLGLPDVRRYFFARITSLAGSAVTYVVMPVLIYSITGSATWTAMVAVAEGLPYLITGLWAGALADHVDRKIVMISTDIAAGLILATVPAAWWLGVLTAPHVLVAAFLTQTVFVFCDAANHGVMPNLVPRDRLPSANSLVFGGATVVDTLVPALTGVIIVAIAPASMIAVDAVTFLVSALLVRGITTPLSGARDHGKAPSLNMVVEGVRFIARHEIVRIMTVVGATQAFSGGAFIALVVVWADTSLGIHEGDWQLGLLFAAWGAGAVLGTIIMPRTTHRFGGVRSALLFLPLSAAGGIATALMTTWFWAVLAIAGWAVAYMVVTANSLTLRQQVTPEPLMSRVMTAGRMVAFGAGYPSGAFTAGVLAESMGAARAMLICQSTLVIGSIIAWASRLRVAPRVLPVAEESPA